MLALCFLLWVSSSYVHGAEQLGAYNVSRHGISVSGLSSGAAMAVQVHVAYSSIIKGMGSFAGLPYHCAQGSVVTAQTTCMASPNGINIQTLQNYVSSQVAAGSIDALDGLRDSRVFIWTGTNDTTVNPAAASKTAEFYQKYIDTSNIKAVSLSGAAHVFPTDHYGGACSTTASPYIANCKYNGAFEMLNHIYGNLIRPSGNVQLNGKFMEYDQTEVVSSARKKRFLLTGTLDVNSYIQSVLNTYLPGGSGIGLLPNFSNPLLDWWKNLLPGSGSGGSSGSGGGSGSGGSLPGISLPGVGGGTSAKSGIDSVGYAYIPSRCIGGSECMLHIAMHGCKMGRNAIGDKFARNAGYNEVAELNNIIVVYPTVVPDTAGQNPNGCYDWWGFTGSNYDVKSGLQMKAVRDIIRRVSGF